MGVVVACSACGADNREGAKFCTECGAPQERACAACGHSLSATARFCDECGTPAIGGAGDASHGTHNGSEAVRKTVTVLFCDLVGSTAFGEAVDAESSRDAMGRYFAMAQSVIERHAGTVVKFIGDGAMAMFGIPEVAEDDADRAVAAGLALQEEFGGIRDHIAGRYGIEVGLRVGVNTGEVVIAADDADIVGDALNTAARLEAACAPGRVLVGEDTWRLTRSHVDYEILGEVSVKGKAEPIATFQVVEELAAVDELATPFVGRDHELDVLRGVLHEARSERVAKLATVIGAPGVGKTRLAAELAQEAEHGLIAFDLRCERSGTATFAPIAELLRSAAGIGSDVDAGQAVVALADLIGENVADRDRVADLLSCLVGVSAPRSTEEMFFAVRRLLEILAAERPVLVVVDDIQWAEPLFLDLLDHLVEWIRDAPVMILVLARPEIREVRAAVTEPGRRVSAVLTIEGLDADATEQLAAQLLGTDVLPAELRDRLPASTDGNPLFVRELVRMLVDDGVVTRTPDGWVMAVDADAIQVPPTIQSLLSTRVERMPADERHFVELASVVGSEFPRGAVAALAKRAVRGEIETTVERLRRKEIIEPTGSYWGDEPVFRFHHVLIRDAAYRRLLKQARADLHLKVGEWTERTADGLVGEFEPAIAFHFEQCHEYRVELGINGDETRAVGERAAALLHTAAAAALERDDLASAGGLARRALDRLAADAPTRSDLLVLACEAMLDMGDVTAGRHVLTELEAVVGDPRLEAWAACFHGQLINLSAPEELSFAEASVGAAADKLEALGDQAGVAKARQVRAGALARLGRVGDCEAELDLALTAARSADDRRRVTAVLGSAPTAALWGPSPVPRAGGRCLDVIRLLRITSGSPAVEATSVRCQAVLEALRGRFDTARTMLEASRATAQELGLDHGLMETELYAGIVELLADQPVDAEPHLRRAYGGLGKLGIGADAGQAAAYLARSLLRQGKTDEADEFATASLGLAGQNPQTLIAARSVEAEIVAARGDTTKAVELAEAAVSLASGRDIVVDHANAYLALARVRGAAGDEPGATAARAEALRLFDQKGASVGDEVATRSSDGPSEERAGEPSAAEPSAAEPSNAASRRAQRIGMLHAAGDWEAFEDALAEAVVLRDRRRGPAGGRKIGDRDTFVAAVRESARVGFDENDFEVIAIRGDDLMAGSIRFRTADGLVDSRISVQQFDDSGRLMLHLAFDTDDVPAAIAELDRLHFATLTAPDAATFDVLRRLRDASGSRDVGAWSDLLTDDFVGVDHRAGIGLEADSVGWLGAVAAQSDLAGDGHSFASQIHVLNDRGAVWSSVLHSTPADDARLSWYTLCAAVMRGERIERFEMFDDSDVDQVLARFKELTAADEAGSVENDQVLASPKIRDAVLPGDIDTAASLWSDASRDGPRGLENAATRVSDLLSDLGVHARFDELEAAVHPDAVAADHALLGGGVGGRADFVAGMRSWRDVWVDEPAGGGPLAIRGDRLALVEYRFGTQGDWRVDRLAMLEVDDDDLLTYINFYDPVHRTVALDELNDRYLAGDGAQYRRVLGAGFEFSAAMNAHDADRAAAVYADDLVVIDHRNLGWGTQDGAALDDRIRAGMEVFESYDVVIRQIHAATAAAACVELGLTNVGADSGGEVTADHLFVVEVDTEGRFLTGDQYALDDLDTALARFDELAIDVPEMSNTARRAADSIGRLLGERDIDGVRELLAPDVVRTDHRTVVGLDEVHGVEAWLDLIRAAFDVGFRSWGGETLAIRGDRLVLGLMHAATPEGTDSQSLVIARTDDDQRVDLLVQFDADDLAHAFDELNRLYVDGEGKTLASLLSDKFVADAAVNAGDWETLANSVPADVRVIDRRPVGFGEMDKAGLLQYVADAAQVAGRRVHGAAQFHVVNERGHVVTTLVAGVEDTGFTGTRWDHTDVLVYFDDELRIEYFDVEDVDAALARFDELTESADAP